MRTVIFAAAVVVAFSTAAMPGNDGPYTTEHWTNGQYAQQSEGAVNLFPNPASDQVSITFPGLTGDAVVSLFAEDGRMMRQIEIGETRSFLYTMDIASLENGMYFIRVVQPSGLDVTRRLMVANGQQ